jgi:hypothetical protein
MVTPIVMGIAITATESIGAVIVMVVIAATGTDTIVTVADIVIVVTVGIEWEKCNE